tara:strand:+ start:7990 stop:11367 length:3378 start_codon:yes stop_codon:yes gene_type:complete
MVAEITIHNTQKKPNKSSSKGKANRRGEFFVGQGQFMVFMKGLSVVMICFTILWSFSGAFAQTTGDIEEPKKPFYSRMISWVGNAAKSVVQFVEQTSSKIAKAIIGYRLNGLATGQVLGESADILEQEILPPIQEPAEPEPFVIPLSLYNISLISQSQSVITSNPGIDHTISVTYSNTGEATWENQLVSLNVFGSDDNPLEHSQWLTSRRPVSITGIVLPGDGYQFNFLISTPDIVGEYELILRPVVFAEGAFNWLGDSSHLVRWRVLVQEPVSIEPDIQEVGGDLELIETPADIIDQVQDTEKELQEEILQDEAETETDEPLVQEKKPSSLPFPILQPDQVAPASQVTALDATTTSASFAVAWTGQDNLPGDRTLTFDAQYQVDSGDWTDWITETILFTSTFTGAVDESTYGFRTRSRDPEGNWEEYPDSADTSTYINLSVPTIPAVTSHTSGDTLFQSADEDSGTTDVQVTLSGTGDANDTLVISLSETSTTATTTVTALGTWSQQFTLAEDTNTFSLQSSEADGDSSSSVAFTLELTIIPTFDVVINEIAWMGTASDSRDEWIELYNASSTALTLTDWTLSADDGTPSITLSGSVAAKSYYLLERTASTTVSDVTEDLIYSGALEDTGERLSLWDDTSTLIDRVGSTTATWFAGNSGTNVTMERIDTTSSGTESSNWADNDETLVNGQDADSTNLKATPGSLNSVNTTIPRTITDLTFQYIYTTSTSVKMYWTAPKTANLATTTTATYDVRYSTSAITDANFSSATQASGEPTPSATQGTAETFTVSGLTANTEYYFAVLTNNGVEDSLVSNSKNITTLQAAGGSYTTLAGYPSGTGGLVASSSSPYLVTANITVANGNTLTIEPGTVLKMSGNFSITVNGSMVMGDSSDSINASVITSEDDDRYGGVASGSDNSPAAGDWGTISASAATSQLSYTNAIISYGGLNNYMVRIASGAQATTTTSIIEQSNSTGISVDGDASKLVLTDSTVSNHFRGVEIDTLANAAITGTTFTGTSPGQTRGIEINSNADVANISITGNNFYANNRNVPSPSAGILYQDTDTLLPAANIADNWWGAASGPTQDTHSIVDDIDGILDDNDSTLTQVGWPVSFATSLITIKPSGL